MKSNKNDNYLIDKSDTSFQKYKYQYNKTNIISQNIYSTNKNINTHNYTTFKNLNRNKSNINKQTKKNKETNYINNNNRINLLRIPKNQLNYNKITKNKFQNSHQRRDCHTPDKNINNLKYNISLTTNKKDIKNNIILLKSNMQRNSSFIEYHFKNNPKRFLTRSKSKYNIYNKISDDRKKALTPDKMTKTRNIKLSKNPINFNKYGENKKIKEPINNFNLSQNYIYPSFSNSFNYYNLNNSNHNINNYGTSNYLLSNNQIMKSSEKRKTPDKYFKNSKYSNYNENKYNSRFSKGENLPVLTNLSKDKFSKSFCSRDNSYDRENRNIIGNKAHALTNLKLNRNKKEFDKVNIHNYYSKAIVRTKSSDIILKQKINSNKKTTHKNNMINNSYLKHNSKNKNNNILINNISYENINKKYKNAQHNLFNNQLIHTNNTFNLSQKNDNLLFYNKDNLMNNKLYNNENNNSFSKNKPKKNYNNINTNTFLEMAQQKINNKNISKSKNNKGNGNNNFITKSSTNTNDDVNSSNSVVSRNNIILDSIEELHFNFVNIELSSRNLMKTQENLEAEKIINNNPNSTVIMVEERDIE